MPSHSSPLNGRRPTVIVAPGAFVTDAAFWYAPLAALLAEHDIGLRAVDLPSCGNHEHLGDLFDDAAAVVRAMDEVDGPVFLAGHSYSGIVITQASAGRADKVKHLLYISGIVGDKCIMESDYVVAGEAPETDLDVRIGGRRLPIPEALLGRAKTGDQGPLGRLSFSLMRRALALDAVDATIGEGKGSGAFKSNELRRLNDPTMVEEGLRRVTRQSLASFLQGPNQLGFQEIPSTYFLGLYDGEVAREQLMLQASRCTNLMQVPTNHFCHIDRPDLVAERIVAVVEEMEAEDARVAAAA
jgi:pimeloyl-ACP methyl ester carboxylesterase